MQRSFLKVLKIVSLLALGIVCITMSRGSVEAVQPRAQDKVATKTVLNGVYTDAQALRGEEVFTIECTECHDGQADGPLLNSDEFTNRWREDSVAHLFTYMKTKMPESDPGSLSVNTYLDLLSYVLWLNKFPAGATELTVDALPDIQFVGIDGPKPLPVGTLVQSVGCFTEVGPQQWALTNASSASRTRNFEETEEGFKALEAKQLGMNRLQLSGVVMLRPAFDPTMYRDYKVYAKGFFTYQDNTAGIDVMEIRPLISACKP
jgi:cytochrome c5